ncbi:ParA family protein [Ruegeria sp. Alg231-54]|uniref:ParA family protein n=1 Tax=Ruegeria sp. Alg231-54 TaxID=1922221 RepID=UPI00131EE287|nr:ParA family protein [Ruegeria sp. Alg231-54]
MKIYAAVNSKGGAGKSSMLVAFASALHHQGKRVRILDLDSQGTLSEWLNPKNGLNPLPADELLIEAGQFSKDDAENARLAYAHILEAEKAAGFDYLLIDTKGEPSMTAAMAMAVADMVLCPSDGSSAEYNPIMVTYRSCEAALKQIGSTADPQDKFRIVFTRQSIAQSAGIQKGKQALEKRFRCVGGIADTAALDDALRSGTTIGRLMGFAEEAKEQAETQTARSNARRMADRCNKALSNADFVLNALKESEVQHVAA